MMYYNAMTLLNNAGLQGLVNTVRDNWLAPAFVLLIMIFAIPLVIKRQTREAGMLVGFAVLVGVLIFGAQGLFGQGGLLQNIGQSSVQEIQGGGNQTISDWTIVNPLIDIGIE